MASVDFLVNSLSANLDSRSTPSAVPFSPKTSTGTGYDVTGGAFTGKMGPAGAALDSAFSTSFTLAIISSSAGKCVLELTLTSNLPAGTYPAAIYFTPSGGTAQLFAQGTVAVK